MAEWAGQLVLVIGYLTLGFDDCRLAWEGLLMLNSNISDVACLQDALRTSIGTICENSRKWFWLEEATLHVGTGTV